jgi:hypothetical protein
MVRASKNNVYSDNGISYQNKFNMASNGYLFVAFGERYVKEAAVAVQSLRDIHPNANITLVTDGPERLQGFDQVIHRKPLRLEETYSAGDISPYYIKIDAMRNSPYERTLMIDTDAHVQAPIDQIFTLLDNVDLVVTPSAWAVEYKFELTEPGFAEVPECFGSFNTGVIAFKNTPAFEGFRTAWLKLQSEKASAFTTNDQPAFRAALFHSRLPFHVLPQQYNVQPWKGILVPSGTGIKIIHTRNPWYIRFAPNFKGSRGPLGVGNIRLKYSLLWYGAKVLYGLQRLAKRF